MMYPRSDLSFAENFLFPGQRKKVVKVKVAFKKNAGKAIPWKSLPPF